MFAHTFDNAGPFGFDRPGGPRFGDPFRAGRGMMEPAILGALLDHPMHGYEIISFLEEKSHGMWRPSPGSIYPTLQLLEEKELIVSESGDGKKTYRLTDEGRTAAKKGADQREDQYAHWRETFADRFHGMRDQRKILGETMRLMRDIYRGGDAVQNQELGRAIEALHDRLSEILSEEKS